MQCAGAFAWLSTSTHCSSTIKSMENMHVKELNVVVVAANVIAVNFQLLL